MLNFFKKADKTKTLLPVLIMATIDYLTAKTEESKTYTELLKMYTPENNETEVAEDAEYRHHFDDLPDPEVFFNGR